ncbi:hypothetical protein [Streptomyces sp. GQFP]|uniref:hypothetical protein n=1 Tax=Streptomyces sp. GQFP TaxID=2907545 RepID=UPI001F15FF47|nr:hypothetical protein [Streptomyces sp. GQFP]UIX33352.1 hypothetical protein LUX31_26935 [Streptomyces sp. GQFP]
MPQELILNILIAINFSAVAFTLRYKLRSKGARSIVTALFAISSATYLILAISSAMSGNVIGVIILTLASAFFALEAYAANNWRLGEVYPQPKDWFKHGK